MKRLARIGLLTLAVGLGVTAVILTTTSFSSVAAAGEIDLTLDAMAPEHVASGSMFEVKIIYYNFGTVVAPDAWVTATLPAGTTFITATDRWGEPLPLNRPLTITMNYTDAVGLKRETVRMWTRTVPEGPWAVLGEPARVMSGTLTFTTTHFTQFALFDEAKYKVYLPLTLR